MRLENRVALITGGCGSVGIATAQRLLSEGAAVVLADVASAAQAGVLDALAPLGPVSLETLDVTSEQGWADVLARVVDRHGRLTTLVNNAGVISPEPTPLEAFTHEEWRRVFSVNAEGAFLGMKRAEKLLRGQAGAAIVNIGSISALEGSFDHAIYGASKGALRALSMHAAVGFAGPPGIRVNIIHPGLIWTPLIAPKASKRFGSTEAAKAAFRAMNPMGTIVEPVDVAAAVAFLASDDARMITGAELTIDCGRLVWRSAQHLR